MEELRQKDISGGKEVSKDAARRGEQRRSEVRLSDSWWGGANCSLRFRCEWGF